MNDEVEKALASAKQYETWQKKYDAGIRMAREISKAEFEVTVLADELSELLKREPLVQAVLKAAREGRAAADVIAASDRLEAAFDALEKYEAGNRG